MTRQQLVAITNPCIEAEHCAHPRFKSYALPWSVILTVNSGFE
jgi:hypothetical protein